MGVSSNVALVEVPAQLIRTSIGPFCATASWNAAGIRSATVTSKEIACTFWLLKRRSKISIVSLASRSCASFRAIIVTRAPRWYASFATANLKAIRKWTVCRSINQSINQVGITLPHAAQNTVSWKPTRFRKILQSQQHASPSNSSVSERIGEISCRGWTKSWPQMQVKLWLPFQSFRQWMQCHWLVRELFRLCHKDCPSKGISERLALL